MIVLMVEVLQTALIMFVTFSCLGYHCLCTRVFVIVLMFKVPQTAIDLSIIPYIRKYILTEIQQSLSHYKH